MHVDVSSTALGVVLVQPGEGDLDHPIAYARRNLSFAERNYTITEREGLAMVYDLKNLDIICWVDTLRCSLINHLCNT